MSATTHIQRTALRRLLVVAAGLAALALAAPSFAAAAGSYGWPVKPFYKQQPVRGYFGDPRIGIGSDGKLSHQLHFGIDISAPDGTAVYATQSGRISVDSAHPDVVYVVSGVTEFSYWHVVPAVRSGYAVAYRTLIGHVEASWEHVHFSEAIGGVYVNPLRPGALGPYDDHTAPEVHGVYFENEGAGIGHARLHGAFDLVVETSDETPLAVPGRWAGKPVVPALVRWRLVGDTLRTPWKTAVDFRNALPTTPFDGVYAKWTRQNHPWGRGGRGRYRLYLAHGWNSASVPNGTYRLEIVVSDSRANTTRASVSFGVANG